MYVKFEKYYYVLQLLCLLYKQRQTNTNKY